MFKDKLHKTTIKSDRAYFVIKKRGIAGKRGRGSSKQQVFDIFEKEGKVYTMIVDNCTKSTLQVIKTLKSKRAESLFSQKKLKSIFQN